MHSGTPDPSERDTTPNHEQASLSAFPPVGHPCRKLRMAVRIVPLVLAALCTLVLVCGPLRSALGLGAGERPHGATRQQIGRAHV